MNNNKMNILYLIDSTLNSLLDGNNMSNNSKEFQEKDLSNAREKSKYRLKYNNAKPNKDYFKSFSHEFLLTDSYDAILY